MEKALLILGALTCIAGTYAAPTQSNSSQPNCYDFMLDVPVTATNNVINQLRVDSNEDAVDWTLDLDTWTSPNSTARIVGKINITDTYSIATYVCFPAPENDKHIMQLLTHGALAGHTYWDVTVDDNSYVQAALKAGYTVLNYDRLGVGASEKPDAYTVVQAPLEVEILRVMTEMALNGSLAPAPGSYAPPAPVIPAFDKVVHVGHSLGSLITASFLLAYSNLSSGGILTGLILPTNPQVPVIATSALSFQYAAENNPALFGDRGSGYVVPATTYNMQNLFYHRRNATDPAGFSDELLTFGEANKQPMTTGEWESIHGAALGFGFTPDFAGSIKVPVQYMLGENDFLICYGNCVGAYNETVVKSLLPNVPDLDIYLQPGSGHALTLHRNASAGYNVTLDFLSRNGL